MKLLAIGVLSGLIILYGYSAYRIISNSNDVFWGYASAVIFFIVSVYGAVLYSKNILNKDEK